MNSLTPPTQPLFKLTINPMVVNKKPDQQMELNNPIIDTLHFGKRERPHIHPKTAMAMAASSSDAVLIGLRIPDIIEGNIWNAENAGHLFGVTVVTSLYFLAKSLKSNKRENTKSIRNHTIGGLPLILCDSGLLHRTRTHELEITRQDFEAAIAELAAEEEHPAQFKREVERLLLYRDERKESEAEAGMEEIRKKLNEDILPAFGIQMLQDGTLQQLDDAPKLSWLTKRRRRRISKNIEHVMPQLRQAIKDSDGPMTLNFKV